MFHTTNYRHSLTNTQGIAEHSLLGHKQAMPNEPKHIGNRLRGVMDERGLEVSDVAKLFGVKAPSVYDWLNFGRIAKHHIPKLVREYGHTAEWWITGEGDSNEATKHLTAEQEDWLRLLGHLTDSQRKTFRECFEALATTQQPAGTVYRKRGKETPKKVG